MGLEFQIQGDKVCYTPLKDKCDAIMSWPENQGILFFYISKTLQMIRISFMASLLNAVL